MKLPHILKDTDTHERILLVPCIGEPEFSWSECRCCWSAEGGDRHDCHTIGVRRDNRKNELVDEVKVCTDCLFKFGEV